MFLYGFSSLPFLPVSPVFKGMRTGKGDAPVIISVATRTPLFLLFMIYGTAIVQKCIHPPPTPHRSFTLNIMKSCPMRSCSTGPEAMFWHSEGSARESCYGLQNTHQTKHLSRHIPFSAVFLKTSRKRGFRNSTLLLEEICSVVRVGCVIIVRKGPKQPLPYGSQCRVKALWENTHKFWSNEQNETCMSAGMHLSQHPLHDSKPSIRLEGNCKSTLLLAYHLTK